MSQYVKMVQSFRKTNNTTVQKARCYTALKMAKGIVQGDLLFYRITVTSTVNKVILGNTDLV